jgi:futalosine hydrolase
LLLTVASPIECKAVLAGLDVAELEPPGLWEKLDVGERISVLHTGVGKANAAGATSKELFGSQSYGGVISIGVAGSYEESIGLRSSVLGLKHWMLDEGTIVRNDPDWVSLERSGWAKTSVECDNGELHQHCRSLVDHMGDVATISTISGTNEMREAYLRRGGVMIETMESGAVALVCSMRKVDFADVRIISNFCGERTRDNHDFPGALKQVSHMVRAVVELLAP